MNLPEYKAFADSVMMKLKGWVGTGADETRTLARLIQTYPHLPGCDETGCVPDCAASGSCCNEVANRLHEERKMWIEELAKQVGITAVLREALKKYGAHGLGCTTNFGPGLLCNCGLKAALSESDHSSEPENTD